METYRTAGERDMSDIVDELADLFKLDVDAVHAYDEAIERIDNQAWREQLGTYRDDHQRHVTELTQCIRALGEEPPKASPDFKGLLIEGMTALRGSMGDDQALKAMHQNEEITNRAYSKAAEKSWPADVQPVIERGFADEQRHITWIDQQLSVASGSSASGAGRGVSGR